MTSNSPRLAGVFAFVITLFLCCLPAIAFAQDPSDDSPGLPILELAPESLTLAATDAITSPLTVHAIVRNPITESVDIRLFTIVNAGAVVSPTESTREGVQPDSDVSIPFEISADPDGVAGGSVVFVVEITSSGVSSVTTIATAHMEITPTAPSKPAAPETALFSVTLQSDKQLARGRVEDAFLLLKNESAKSTMIIAAEPSAHGVFTLEPGLSLEGKPVPPASTILVPIRISTAESVLFDVYPFGLEIAFTAQDAPASTKRIASVFENLTVYDVRLKSVALFLDVFSLPSQMTLPFLLGLWGVLVFALLQALWQWIKSYFDKKPQGPNLGTLAAAPSGLTLGVFLIALIGFMVLIVFSFVISLFGSTFLSFDGLYGGPSTASELLKALGIGAGIALFALVLYNLVFKSLLAGVLKYLRDQLQK